MPKIALVTGGASGIGRSIVEDLATDHDVALSYNTTMPATWLPGHAVACDLATDGAPQHLINQVMDHFGQLDLIVNNAGVIAETPAEAIDLTSHRKIFEVNVLAPMALLAAALPHLRPGAAVINISSQNARLPALAAPAYSASKAALETWTRAMAKTLGPRGIRVNAVAPGAVERAENARPPDLIALFEKETALGRLATAQDIAAAVRFLASDKAGAITGEILTVNGGYRL
ncbi:SDR family NAD(P)-dependent oxidoreductase [Actibacterium sp. 188UL27-1]|uniref:SDR family NAD(P)-dependent oxidoreductase n=1 Tax=Actibacterium sp. 188UL27-1 TaxID=2786961 RepID=UPI00195B05BE|nr:SDR family oxidoreductase [Actibacterium sp. 188UL27-1]MBM7069588.1 SDR family oxidoreductase [Actibacterium sp. 188UL27-1]